jgi:hypothetical protein
VNTISEKISQISKQLIFPEDIEEQFTSFDQTILSTQNVFNHFLKNQSSSASALSAAGLSSSMSGSDFQDNFEDATNSPLTLLSHHLAQR